MKDYAAMSDQQINQLVGCNVGEMQLGARSACCIGSDGNVLVLKGGMWKVFDPCNNPADAWPILLENHIAIAPYKNATPCAWPSAEGLISKHVAEDANPLRAGMITLLKMKESKND